MADTGAVVQAGAAVIPLSLLGALGAINPWIAAFVFGLFAVAGALVKVWPDLMKARGAADDSLRKDLMSHIKEQEGRIDRLELQINEQSQLLIACERRDSSNRTRIERITFCTLLIKEKLPIDDPVRATVDNILKGDWSLPETDGELAQRVRELDR